jgi:hypothetical protein
MIFIPCYYYSFSKDFHLVYGVAAIFYPLVVSADVTSSSNNRSVFVLIYGSFVMEGVSGIPNAVRDTNIPAGSLRVSFLLSWKSRFYQLQHSLKANFLSTPAFVFS